VGSIPGLATYVYSAFHPSGVDKSSTSLVGWGYGGTRSLVLGDPLWQVMLRSSVMGFPLRAILGFKPLTFYLKFNASKICAVVISTSLYHTLAVVLQYFKTLFGLLI